MNWSQVILLNFTKYSRITFLLSSLCFYSCFTRLSLNLDKLFPLEEKLDLSSTRDLLPYLLDTRCWSSRPEMFCKKGFLRNFAKFTGNYLRQSLFFNKVADLRPATLLKKRLAQVLFSEFCKISKNIFSYRTPAVAVSKNGHWTYTTRSEDVEDVLWTTDLRSIYVLCLGGMLCRCYEAFIHNVI